MSGQVNKELDITLGGTFKPKNEDYNKYHFSNDRNNVHASKKIIYMLQILKILDTSQMIEIIYILQTRMILDISQIAEIIIKVKSEKSGDLTNLSSYYFWVLQLLYLLVQ